MILDYGTQLSPHPIELSVGTIKKPTLFKISEITYQRFTFYEVFLKMTPKLYYTDIKKDSGGTEYWNSLTKEERNTLTLYQAILKEKGLQELYVEIFNFFFVEPVIFLDGYFVILNKNIQSVNDIVPEKDVRGIISENILLQVLEVIQQVCGIYEKDKVVEESKFKNKLAKKLYEKMQKGEQEKKEKEKVNPDYSLANIVSSVSNNHPTISPTTVYDLTIFQLLDSFNRLQLSKVYEIDKTRVSVWGDEKNTFNASLWYKNEYDKE